MTILNRIADAVPRDKALHGKALTWNRDRMVTLRVLTENRHHAVWVQGLPTKVQPPKVPA